MDHRPEIVCTHNVRPGLNRSCLFAAGSPTDTVGSQNFRTFSTRQIDIFEGGAADAGNATPNFFFSVPAIPKMATLTAEQICTAPTETAKHHILAIDEAS